MESDVDPASPIVIMNIQLTGGSSTQKIQSPKLALAAAPAWIAGNLAQTVLHRAAGQKPLDAAEQVARFGCRADEFTELGAWDQAVKLREATLLVQPAEVLQRVKLVDECLALVSPRVSLDAGEIYPGSPAIKMVYGRKVDWYLQALDHVEYLIRNRQIDRKKALDLCLHLMPQASLNYAPARFVIQISDQYYRVGQEELARAQKPARKFFLEIAPKVLNLPPPVDQPKADRTDAEFVRMWQSMFLDGVLQRADVSYPLPKDLADLARAYTQILPDGLQARHVELPRMPWEYGPRAAMPDDYTMFYHALAASSHKISSIRGRYMLLEQEVKGGRLRRERAVAILQEMDKLEQEYRSVLPLGERQLADLAWSGPKRLCARIQAAFNPPLGPAVAPSPPKARPGPSLHIGRPQDESTERTTTGAVRFVPVTLTVKRLDGSVEKRNPESVAKPLFGAAGMDVVQCGAGADVYCHRGGLYRMKKAGLLEELIRDGENCFQRGLGRPPDLGGSPRRDRVGRRHGRRGLGQD